MEMNSENTSNQGRIAMKKKPVEAYPCCPFCHRAVEIRKLPGRDFYEHVDEANGCIVSGIAAESVEWEAADCVI